VVRRRFHEHQREKLGKLADATTVLTIDPTSPLAATTLDTENVVRCAVV
jgi:hypothetical protein